jgi:glycosyltransferase involved in cell wall biosynthesis
MDRARIALLVPTLEIGGVERVFANLANGLSQCGAEVDVVVGLGRGSMRSFLPHGIQVFDLNSPRMIRAVSGMAKYLKARKPDAVIAAMTHSSAAAVLARKLAGSKTKIIATEHSTMSQIVANTPGLKYRWMPMWSRWTLNSADAVVAVSAGVADDLSAQTGIRREAFHVIYNPVITDSLRSAANVSVEHPWFQPGEPPVILAVGRLDKQKDFSMLVRAFREVRNRRPARLVILGEGPDRIRIEKAVQDAGLTQDVALPGAEQNPYKFMHRAAAFALSSKWEGFGVVLVEALALGLPVVATNCKHGPSEILCNGKFGALVPVGNHDAMAQALLETLNRPLRSEMTDHLEQFTVRNIAQRYLSLAVEQDSRKEYLHSGLHAGKYAPE